MTIRPRFFAQAGIVARRDVRRERRSGEVMWVTIPFGAIALLLVPLAIGTERELLHDVGVGMFWVVVMLFGVLIAIRQTHAESGAQRDALALTGVDPAAVFMGRSAASFLLLMVFEIALGFVTIALYDVAPSGWFVTPAILIVAAAGLAMLGTLAASIVAQRQSGAALVPLLVAPLSVPLLLGASESLEALRFGRSSLPWILMMVIVTLLVAVVGVLSAGPLQETQ